MLQVHRALHHTPGMQKRAQHKFSIQHLETANYRGKGRDLDGDLTQGEGAVGVGEEEEVAGGLRARRGRCSLLQVVGEVHNPLPKEVEEERQQ